MQETMELANSTILWLIVFIVVALVIFQAIMFLLISVQAGKSVGLQSKDMQSAAKTGLISGVGPSLGIAIVVIAIITLIGSPLTLMRIGIIGSAATETAAAGIGASTYGVQLGGENFSYEALTSVVWTMCLGGTGWLLFTLLFTKSLGRIQEKVSKKSTKMMSLVSLGALLGVFGFLTTEEMVQSMNHALTALSAAGAMVIIMIVADRVEKLWLKEWALGFSLIIGMTVGYVTTLL
ncbi:DUF5058 family protein [Geomicrobium sp. JCM 19039]|uniref:DUF5058 family protein n=1 Tax=Geomicrobium sp. JCM 19039 TaxID=1460636 RepID=UPI0005AA3187|nr:DUF5058 family protein [Geomicrobium sp. JCM 19039]